MNAHIDKTNETPLHNALAKAGRPYYFYVVKLLVDKGADVNGKTISGLETGAFMREVRTKGETPLHRAAAYADEKTISYLIEHGADKTAKDVNGNSPLSWASEHLRPGVILSLLIMVSIGWVMHIKLRIQATMDKVGEVIWTGIY